MICAWCNTSFSVGEVFADHINACIASQKKRGATDVTVLEEKLAKIQDAVDLVEYGLETSDQAIKKISMVLCEEQ